MGNKLVWRSWPSDDSHPKLELSQGWGCSTTSDQRSSATYNTRLANNQFECLPEDVLWTILSKLPLKDVVRTSVLSTKWRHMWKACPKLSFDGFTAYGSVISGRQGQQKHVLKFIDSVNTVLQHHRGEGVEELAIKFEFHPMLVDHLNSWVRFAVTSRIKFLSFDLLPETWGNSDDRYIFPFELLDHGSICRLQHIRLSFLWFTPCPQFRGFPKLRKLDLDLVRTSGKDLQTILSNCCNLEWLSIVRCNVNGELKVGCPLPQLQYLNIQLCNVTKLELCAAKLATFKYKGRTVPISLMKSLELENVHIHFYNVTIEHFVTVLPDELPNVQSLTLRAAILQPKISVSVENPCKFSHLKHMRLLFSYLGDVTMSLVSILRASPVMEKLEMHFSVLAYIYADEEPLKQLPEHRHSHLREVCITGFVASKGQLELLVHVAENAPALEVLTVDVTDFISRKDPEDHEKSAMFIAKVRNAARSYLEGKVSPKCCLRFV